jgi:hypothetical protein
MALEHVPRCQHVKVNGVQCGSPALRNRSHCFFHTRAEHERQLAVENTEGKRSFGFPLLEDANSIQVALMKVIQMLGAGVLDHKTASLMLYALQTASYNLRQTRFEPEKATEVVIDEDTVDLTRIKGPQWTASDFPPGPPPEVDDIMRDDAGQDEVFEEDRVEEDMPEMPPAAQVPAPAPAPLSAKAATANAPRVIAARKPAAVPVDPMLADVARRREQKRKLPKFDVEQAMEEQPDSLATVLLRRMGLPVTDEEEEEMLRAEAQQQQGATS